MSTACFYGRELNENSIRKIGELGVKRAEIFFSGLTEYKPSFVKQIASVCGDYGIEMVSVHAMPTQFEPQMFSRHPKQYRESVEIYNDVLAAAQLLGAGVYVFHGPIHLKTARKLDLDMDLVAERADIAADIAKQYGVKFCYENVHWCWFKTPDFARELAARAKSDNLYFTLDIKQAAQSGFGFEEYIAAMGKRLAHVHVCDYTTDPQNGIMPRAPFTGCADFTLLKKELQKINFDGCLMLEIYIDNYGGYDELRDIYAGFERFFAL